MTIILLKTELKKDWKWSEINKTINFAQKGASLMGEDYWKEWIYYKNSRVWGARSGN